MRCTSRQMMATALVCCLMGVPVMAQGEAGQETAPATASDGDVRAELDALKTEISAMRSDMRAVLRELQALKAAQAQAAQPRPPQQQRTRPAQELLGKPAPEVSFKTVNNEDRKLGGQSDKVKVAFFYATWCGYCKRTLPGIDKLNKDFEGKDVEVIAISLDAKEGQRSKTEPELIAFLEEMKVSVPLHWDPERKVGNQYKVQSFPTSFVVGKNGVIEAVHIGGPVGLDKTIAEEVNKLLAGESLVKAEAKS